MRLALMGKVRELKRKSLVGQVVVVLLGVQLLFFSSFIALNIPTATGSNLEKFIKNSAATGVAYLPRRWQQRALDEFPVLTSPPSEVRRSIYVPNTPAAMFVGYILGPILGPIAGVLFIVLGLAGPIFGVLPFAEGGGLEYYKQAGFGYLLGMVLASWAVGALTARKRSTFTQVLAVLAGAAAVHCMGIAFLLGSTLVTNFLEGTHAEPWHQWLFEVMRNLSWYALPYDLLFGIALIGLGFPFRALVGILTAPDIIGRPKPQPKIEELL